MDLIKNMPNLPVQQAISELKKQRETALALPADQAMNYILNARQPTALVHSIAETDLYLLIQETGTEDALPLIALASNRQWEFILDMSVWNSDRIDVHSLTQWLNLLFSADPDRFLRWIQHDHTEFIEWYLFNNIQIRALDPDEEPADIPDAFMTLDNIFYFRFLSRSEDMELPEDGTDPSGSDEKCYQFITQLLEKFYAEDPIQYYGMMLEAQTVIPAETEEDEFRMRNVRMAEKGFLPFDEAVGIYQPIKPDAVPNRINLCEKNDESMLPIPAYISGMLTQDNLFVRSLVQIEQDPVLSEIQTELASLTNQMVIADQKHIASRADIEAIVKKVVGYLTIGLECLSEEKPLDAVHCAALIQSRTLSGIFRLGYGAALELKWTAQKWMKQSWFSAQKLTIGFWGEEWVGVLGGLLIKKPLFFDNYQTGVIYREFQSMEDVIKTRTSLNQIMGFDHILGAMTDDLAPFLQAIPSRKQLSYQNLVLTRWAQFCLELPPEAIPIPMDRFVIFFRDLFDKLEKPDTVTSRKITQKMKLSFLSWLSERTHLTSQELADFSGQQIRQMFTELEDELGSVSEADLMPQYIQLFLV